MNINNLLRKNIQNLHPYSCARDEFKGEASVLLDANENPYHSPYNRYPDPMQWELKLEIGNYKKVKAENIFLGNGSDEAIDLLYRAFCEPRLDNVVAIEPTYGMYKVCADINDVEYRKVLLDSDFHFSADKILAEIDEKSKLIWLCTPNNPSGNLLNKVEIVKVLERFNGIVVVDEAYIDFAEQESFSQQLSEFDNLVVLQTFSKAWGSAGVRLGMAFAQEDIIASLNKIKYPYNLNILTQKFALDILSSKEKVNFWIKEILIERTLLINELKNMTLIKHIYPTDANFVLVKVEDANSVYNYLVSRGIIIRNRNNVALCNGCLRITIGTTEENKILIQALNDIK